MSNLKLMLDDVKGGEVFSDGQNTFIMVKVITEGYHKYLPVWIDNHTSTITMTKLQDSLQTTPVMYGVDPISQYKYIGNLTEGFHKLAERIQNEQI